METIEHFEGSLSGWIQEIREIVAGSLTNAAIPAISYHISYFGLRPSRSTVESLRKFIVYSSSLYIYLDQEIYPEHHSSLSLLPRCRQGKNTTVHSTG